MKKKQGMLQKVGTYFFVIMGILTGPFALMLLAYVLFAALDVYAGGQLFGSSEATDVAEILNLYGSYFNALVMSVLTAALAIVALKDFQLNLAPPDVAFSVGGKVRYATNDRTTYFHVPISFWNNSKQVGLVKDVRLDVIADERTYPYKLESTALLRHGESGEIVIYDGISFSHIPVEGGGVLRETLTFHPNFSGNLPISDEYSFCFTVETSVGKRLQTRILLLSADKRQMLEDTREEIGTNRIHGRQLYGATNFQFDFLRVE